MTIQSHSLENQKYVSTKTILEHISDHKDLIKFSLSCIKDCLHLKYKKSKHIALNCIRLVEQWITDPNSVSNEELQSAAVTASYHSYESACAIWAINPINNSADGIVANIKAVIVYVSHHFYVANKKRNEFVRQQKLNEYKIYALSLLRTSDIDKSQLKIKGRIDDKSTLMALLDNLNDLNEKILISTNKGIQLNCPMEIVAGEMNELIDKIWNNRMAIHYLEHLYS
jgi:hypothetical protein